MEQPFSAVMADALYGPDGYYTKHVKIGKDGDFYTAASNNRLFAATLAAYVTNMWQSLGEPCELQVLEFGGGQGELAGRLLQVLLEELPGVSVSYRIREVSKRLQDLQTEAVKHVSEQAAHTLHGAVCTDMPTVIIGNELLDAFPVDLVRRTKTEWLQAFIDDGDRHHTIVWRAAQADVAAFADRYVDCPLNGVAEVCLGYERFFKEAYDVAPAARLLLFDYGITKAEWQTGLRMQGTIRGYHRHEVLAYDELICRHGDVDITADVNWDAAAEAAIAAGWDVQPLTTQGQFLMGHGIMEVAAKRLTKASDTEQRAVASAIKQLVLPGGMGERFQVLECHRAGRASCYGD